MEPGPGISLHVIRVTKYFEWALEPQNATSFTYLDNSSICALCSLYRLQKVYRNDVIQQIDEPKLYSSYWGKSINKAGDIFPHLSLIWHHPKHVEYS